MDKQDISESMHPALLVQIMFLEKLGSEILRRCQAVRAAFGCEVHQVPVGPDRIHMIALQLRPPEVKNPIIVFSEHMEYRSLHIVTFALA